MSTGNVLNAIRVVEAAVPLETLLSESKRLQAISLQLIRESRELRTICLLTQHGYQKQHNLCKKHPTYCYHCCLL
jgi:hypothetical protein